MLVFSAFGLRGEYGMPLYLTDNRKTLYFMTGVLIRLYRCPSDCRLKARYLYFPVIVCQGVLFNISLPSKIYYYILVNLIYICYNN